jgi:hypothetical protein
MGYSDLEKCQNNFGKVSANGHASVAAPGKRRELTQTKNKNGRGRFSAPIAVLPT